jgi:hypothetical protein
LGRGGEGLRLQANGLTGLGGNHGVRGSKRAGGGWFMPTPDRGACVMVKPVGSKKVTMNAAVPRPDVSHSGSHITTAPLRAWIRRAGQRLGTWVEAHAAATRAAAHYEDLSRLCDAELHRRGLSRSTLARDVARTFE